MKYKCDCGYQANTKADMVYHVEEHQAIQERQMDEDAFESMMPHEQQYQMSMGYVQ